MTLVDNWDFAEALYTAIEKIPTVGDRVSVDGWHGVLVGMGAETTCVVWYDVVHGDLTCRYVIADFPPENWRNPSIEVVW